MIKIEWWNKCDLADIVYSIDLTFTGVIEGDYHNVVYLDVDVTKPEYVLEEEAQENHEQTVIVQNQKWTKKYRCEYKAPEFMADALTVMQLHDNIYITLPDDEPVKVKDINVSVEWPEAGGHECFANIILEWSFEDIIKTACCQNGEAMYYIDAALGLASTNDGQVDSASVYNASSADVKIGYLGMRTYESWFRFTNINIPQGATILSAKMRLIAHSTPGSGANVSMRIRMADVDDAVAPTNTAEFIDIRNNYATTAYENWNTMDTWDANTAYYTPDFAAVVKEVVDRPGWVSGNDMMVLLLYVSATAGHYRSCWSWNGDAHNIAHLYITYKL